jgi:uncharacterized protein
MKAFGCVRSLHVYPLKGARGITLAEADVLATGLAHDRRFVVASSGAAITQRMHPSLARVVTAIEGDALVVTCFGMNAIPDLAHGASYHLAVGASVSG